MNAINTANGGDEEWPSWNDIGKRVCVIIDGKTIVGILEMDEVYNVYAEDVDTLYLVRNSDGIYDFQYADAWGFTDDADQST